jgi:adenosylmethionine-8-amino-7-oxononanoate aminotransferase
VPGQASELTTAALRHLMLHYTSMGGYADGELPIIVKGDGCYLEDIHGRRYLDALAGLFTVNIGYGYGDEMGEAAAAQMRELPYYTNWTYAHPRAIELATEMASLAPGDLNRVFFTSGGSEAVESAWKLARQYFRAIGQGQRHKVIAREIAYHGTTLGALAITGIPSLRTPFEPLTPGASHVANTNRYRHPLGDDEKAFMLDVTNAIEDRIRFEGPDTVAAVFLEPLQNGGGCFVPPEGYFQRVREICDRYGVLLVSDEVICAFGRLGDMFGCEHYDYLPDMITCAKGLTSGYSPLGAVICRDALAEPFLAAPDASFLHGITFAGHPVSCAVGLANLDIFDDEHLLDTVRTRAPELRARLDGLRDIPIVGDVRGAGYFWAIELVRDQATKETFPKEERDQLLRGFMAPRLYDAGLICRTDDRGDPIVQLAPPLIAGPEEFDFIERTLRRVLVETWGEFGA